VNCTRCSRNSAKVLSLIQPDLVDIPMDPGSAHVMKWSLSLTLGKINMGGAAFPAAFIVQTTVTRSPLSADVREPTSFLHFSVTTCFGVCTVFTPVSSIL